MRLSRRTIWLVGSVGLVVLAVLFFMFSASSESSSYEASGPPEKSAHNLIQAALSESFSETDSDNDGLYDWEESLWQTDKNNPDTDGDGTSDGEEVDQNRNPLREGPDDTLDLSSGAFSGASNSPQGIANSTDVFAQDFFAKYLTLRQAGEIQNANVENLLFSGVLEKQQIPFLVNVLSGKDIPLQVPATSENMRSYGNALGAIFARWSIGERRNEAVIVLDALERDSPEVLEELVPIQKGYAGMYEDVRETAVPENALALHLAFLNSIGRIETTIRSLQGVFSDPLPAISALSVYQDNATSLGESVLALRDFFKTHAIEFHSLESGNVFIEAAGG